MLAPISKSRNLACAALGLATEITFTQLANFSQNKTTTRVVNKTTQHMRFAVIYFSRNVLIKPRISSSDDPTIFAERRNKNKVRSGF